MKNFLSYLFCFLFGLLIVAGFRYLQVKNFSPFTAQTTNFTFQPPSQAVSGLVTDVQGNIEKLSREDGKYSESSPGAEILIGESVATKINSQAMITIGDSVTIAMNEETEVTFANLFPENMTLQQKAGTSRVSLTSSSHPVSMRVLHALVTIYNGETTIAINGARVSITVATGRTKIAQVDRENNTHVYELTAGERATIDDEQRKITISPR